MFCSRKNVLPVSLLLILCLLLPVSFCWAQPPSLAEKPEYSLSLYGARMTDNSMADFVDSFSGLEFEDAYLLTLALSRCINSYRELVSFELEGQVVKHFDQQGHWELNALLAARWEPFFWDEHLDTSLAVGVGPSYATAVPEIEVQRGGASEHLQAYMLVELEFVLPAQSQLAVISRIHHRSNAFGMVADSGSSNALAVGLKYKF